VVLAGSLALGSGDYASYQALLARLLRGFMQIEADTPDPEVSRFGLGGAGMVRVIILLLPMIAASVFCLFFVANAWLAGKAVQISGRLIRPWPVLFTTRMPPLAIALLFGALAAAFLPGYLSVAGMGLFGALAMAFALQGLALLHHMTVGRPGRVGILVCTYILTLFFGGTFLPLMAVAGLVDTATSLRRRLTLTPGRDAGLT
jgi:hypothetical protein